MTKLKLKFMKLVTKYISRKSLISYPVIYENANDLLEEIEDKLEEG